MAIRICVCVKVVPRAAVPLRMDPTSFRLDRSGATELNDPDTYALEEALQLRDRVGGELSALTVAPAEGQESLRVALAMGADRAIVVSDPGIAGSDLLGTSRILAAAIRREATDLVVFGSGSIDGAGGQLWSAVAERLEQPVLSGLRTIEVAEGNVRGERQVPGGDLVVRARLPCVVALAGSASVPRYPAFRDIVSARKKPIELLSLADLGLGIELVGVASARTTVLALSTPPPRRQAGEVIADEGRGAAWLAAVLAARGLA